MRHARCKAIAAAGNRGFPRSQARQPAGRRRNFVYNFSRMLRFLTAGESHGQALVVDSRRHAGRARDRFRRDHRASCGAARAATAAAGAWRSSPTAPRSCRGVRHGVTTGAPDRAADPEQGLGELAAHDARRAESRRDARRRATARAGHAAAARATPTSPASSKYGHDDMRDVLERASARETAARVAVGAIARQLLRSVGIRIVSHVVRDRRRRPAADHAASRSSRRAALAGRRAAALRRCRRSSSR